MISSFTGKYRFLSNFAPVEVQYAGYVYPSVENAYVAAKTDKEELRGPLLTLPPGMAKRYGKTIPLRAGWKSERLPTMQLLLRQKFWQEPYSKLLLATGTELLVEGNSWNDTYWGVCNGQGCNYLGLLLMQIRSELIHSRR